jgi:hypothetical protein
MWRNNQQATVCRVRTSVTSYICHVSRTVPKLQTILDNFLFVWFVRQQEVNSLPSSMEQSPYKLIVTKFPVFSRTRSFIVVSAGASKQTLISDRRFPAHDTHRSYHSEPGRWNSQHKLINLNVAYAVAQSVHRWATGCRVRVGFPTGTRLSSLP